MYRDISNITRGKRGAGGRDGYCLEPLSQLIAKFSDAQSGCTRPKMFHASAHVMVRFAPCHKTLAERCYDGSDGRCARYTECGCYAI